MPGDANALPHPQYFLYQRILFPFWIQSLRGVNKRNIFQNDNLGVGWGGLTIGTWEKKPASYGIQSS